MKFNLTELTDTFRTCAFCGSFTAKRILCNHCWGELPMRDRTLASVEIDFASSSVMVLSLLDWYPNQSPVGSSLIAGLKGGGLQSSFDLLASEFVNRWLFQKYCSEEILLIPAPTKAKKRGPRHDHASSWSHSLARAIGAQTNDCLRTSMTDSQKTKSREARARTYMTCEPADYEKIAQFKGRIIFADDVVTTGSTAKAAYIALGRPQRFQVWSIAYRHLAAD